MKFRLPEGGRIDRDRLIPFHFDGVSYSGYEGDTLSSALLANGVHLVGRSYKYHRPRGILSAGAEEPNALVGLDEGEGRFTPNLRATQIPLTDGLQATSQNRWPSLKFDLGALAELASPALSAGFYYKTFIGPGILLGPWLWSKAFEPLLRQAAGLGTPPRAADPDAYAQYYDHCDVLVVGAGPAGLAAARAAALSGARVILCDEQAEFGGSLLHERNALIDGATAPGWLNATLAALEAAPNVHLLAHTQAFGYWAENFVGLNEIVSADERRANPDAPRERLWQVRANQVVLAAGAIERPLVFPDNDRPGVMLAEAARIYLNRYAVKVGERVVVAAAHESAYRVALDLAAEGIAVVRIVDLRPEPSEFWQEAAREAGIAVTVDARLLGTRGRSRVRAVGIVSGYTQEWIGCDTLLMSGGWTPSVHLFSQSRGKLDWDPIREAFVPGVAAQRVRSAGACKGAFGLEAALNEGAAAGAAAGRDAGFAAAEPAPYAIDNAPAVAGGVLGDMSAVSGKPAFVDFQSDVTAQDIRQAVREGFRSVEHLKRYTAVGMATDQGKTSNLNALAIAAEMLDVSDSELGLTSYRPPYTPVTFGALAGAARGDLFAPVRKTPLHAAVERQGAVFEDQGLWKRARYFPRAGEDELAAVKREVKAVRERVGFTDASTLGKIEVAGPDAAKFLDRIYVNGLQKLAVGRCRYGLMLNESGFVLDDGVIARLGFNRFHVTTTTIGAARVMHHMEDYLQTEFADLKCWLTSVTEQWATIAVQGPRSRDLLWPFVTGADIAPAAFPHLSVAECEVAGARARLMRIGFTGELGFEINVPADLAESVWDALWEDAHAFDPVVYGTRALHVLRAEKGYFIVGQDSDGEQTPDDLGLSGLVGKAKGDFVGKRSLTLASRLAPERKQLVGLVTDDPGFVLEEGAQLVAESSPAPGTHALGHVASAYFSPTLERSIALALVEGGRLRQGARLCVPTAQGETVATVTDPVFYDPEGKRLHV